LIKAPEVNIHELATCLTLRRWQEPVIAKEVGKVLDDNLAKIGVLCRSSHDLIRPAEDATVTSRVEGRPV